MDETACLAVGVKKFADARKGAAGIVGQKKRAAIVRIGAELAAGYDQAGMADRESRGVTGIAENRHFAESRIGQLGNIVDEFFRALLMKEFCPHASSDLAQ